MKKTILSTLFMFVIFSSLTYADFTDPCPLDKITDVNRMNLYCANGNISCDYGLCMQLNDVCSGTKWVWSNVNYNYGGTYTMTPGQEYVIYGWINATYSGNDYMHIYFSQSGGSSFRDINTVNLTNVSGWTFFSQRFIAMPNIYEAKVFFDQSKSSGYSLITNLSVGVFPSLCAIENTVSSCTDGFDNDFDHLIDSQDPDCPSENCGNGFCNFPTENEANCLADCAPVCNNGYIGGTEQCESGNLNGHLCSDVNLYEGDPLCSSICTVDYSGCSAQCGNGFCEDDTGETGETCPSDCGLYGWHTTDMGWTKNAENRLVATTAENAIDIYSDPFEMKINSTYILSAGLIESSCEVYVDLNDGKCVSRTDWLEDTCFDDQSLSDAGEIIFDTPITPITSTHASQGFFKNVSIRIHVPANCAMAKFDDISFKEVSPINPYHDLQPDINLTTACCPKEYCWDGSRCVLSDPWYLSNNSNLWSLLNIDVQVNRHINTSLQWLAKGYRCSLNETGYADWTPAEIKYDWHYNESGYCIRETDCFVSQTFSGFDIPLLLGEDNINNSGSSCIKDGQFINDAYEINKGNHYCMNGEWTTKTYLIANVLENITNGNSYIIFCDVKDRLYNFLENTPRIDGGCTLIEKDDNTERIVIGFYSNDPYEVRNGEYGDYVMYDSIYYYAQMLGYEITPPPPDTGICDPVASQFVRCWNDEVASGAGLYFYYNNNSHYYLMSNKPIPQIDNNLLQQVWNNIVNFFQRLFGYTPEEPLGLARQTQNYEKLYVLSNNTLKVSAVEEKKYDEELVRNMVYMYLNMSGSGMNDQANKFNIDFVNNSVQGAYYTFDESSTSRVLVIKYNNVAELWPYLTAMLRDRP